MKILLPLLLLAPLSSAAALALKDVDGDDLCAPSAVVLVEDQENTALSRDLTTALQAALRASGVKWSTDKNCALTLGYSLDAFYNKKAGAYLYNSTLELAANGAHVDTVETLLGETLEADLNEEYLILDQSVQYGITSEKELAQTGRDAVVEQIKSMLR